MDKRGPNWAMHHQCPQYAPTHSGIAYEDYHDMHGGAISNRMAYEANSRRWWIDNGEYASPVCFCPWCGVELATLVSKEAP